jgi:predicted methyltransferase
MRHLIWLAIPLLSIAACGSKSNQEPKAPETAPSAAATATVSEADSAAIDAAVASADRPADDREQDAWRKPAEVLKYLELRPGMHVLDYLAAAGYYTELISRVVGPQGQVIAYNNPPYLKFSGDKPAQRYANNRLANVAQLTTPSEEAPLEPQTLDAALFLQVYHDLYWRPTDGSWPATDPAKSLAKVVAALKPGAIVVVVDHVAPSGADPTATVNKMHRIDPAIIKRDFEAAGLTFEGESPLFRNEADDHTKEVFDASIRHKTDQVMYKFRKP